MGRIEELRKQAEAMVEGVTAYYEYDADLFYQETGHLAPGKDDRRPPTISYEEHRDLWIAFMDRRRVEGGKNLSALLDLVEKAQDALTLVVEDMAGCPIPQEVDDALEKIDAFDKGESDER